MEKKINTVLLPLAYLPPISWFYFFLNSNNALVEQFETYPKQTYRNRCKIFSGNGKLDLIIPVRKPNGNRTLTKDIEIGEDKKWRQNHWRAICSAYLNSPYFEYYRDEFEGFYQNKQKSLPEFNLQLIRTIIEIIGINKEIGLSESYDHKPENVSDFRTVLHPKRKTETLNFPEYIQVFSAGHGFLPNLSILDLLFNLGPETPDYLLKIKKV